MISFMFRFLVGGLVAVIAWLSVASVALADGATTTRRVCHTTYGNVTECVDEEVPVEVIEHEPIEEVELVETGIVDEVLLPVGLFGAGAVVLAIVGKRAAI